MTETLVNPSQCSEDVCAICLDNLENEQIYSLPECGHKFHTNCMFHWLRAGHCKCPFCGNCGEQSNVSNNSESGWIFSKDKYIILRRYSRRKDAPLQLKKQIQKLKELEHKKSEFKIKQTEILNKEGNFKEIKKLYEKNRRNMFRHGFRINTLKWSICRSNYMIPLIILKKKIID